MEYAAAMSGHPQGTVPRALVWATEIDVLPEDRVVERREGRLVVRSPGHPHHYWGNLLIFDGAPGAGDGERWEEAFAVDFADEPQVRHQTFAWGSDRRRPRGGRGGVRGEGL